MELVADRLNEYLTLFGRTFFDAAENTLFFNWSGSGFELTYCGTKTEIELEAYADFYPAEGKNLPWIAVIADGAWDEPKIIGLSEGTGVYTVHESREPETHTLRIIKRSENSKGRVGAKKITVAGELLKNIPVKPRRRLEFIGDSITCGFGIETDGNVDVFKTALENGLESYGAVAAGLLGAEYHSICISGIPLCRSYNDDFRIVLPDFPDFTPPVRAMEDYYAYTDRFHQEMNGVASGFEKWDFGRFKPDAIIVNLGTNDAFRVMASGNDPREEQHFEKRYKEFLHQLRRLNGEKPVIACTLGPMDYYLYDNILSAARAYREETGDDRLFCYKYGGIFLWDEGIGALGHPSAKTHRRMGKELAEVLEKWL